MPILYFFHQIKIVILHEILGSIATTHLKKLSLIQNSAMRLSLGVPKTSPIRAMETEHTVMPIEYYVQTRVTRHLAFGGHY